MSRSFEAADAANDLRIHLLDVGDKKYGDAVLCKFGNVSVMIDGAHPTDSTIIVNQLRELLNQEPPFEISLLIITHPHDDHIGCAPSLVANNKIRPKWALVADPQYRWGEDDVVDDQLLSLGMRARGLVEALREEDRADLSDEELTEFIDSVSTVRERYTQMIRTLTEEGTIVVRHGTDDATELKAFFQNVGLNIAGPTLEHLRECRRLLAENENDAVDAAQSLFSTDAPMDIAAAYRALLGSAAADWFAPNKGAINLQSIVSIFEYGGKKILFAGDMQFAKPEVQSTFLKQSMRELQDRIENEAPFDFYKVSHHGSHNAFSEAVLERLGGTALFGICGGRRDPGHPDQEVLELLNEHRDSIQWARTDHNGQTTVTFGQTGPIVDISRGELNDATPNTGATDEALIGVRGPAVTVMRAAPPNGNGTLEISARVPSNATQVSITVALGPARA